MIITPVDDFVIPLTPTPGTPPRSPGHHVSTILRYVAQRLGKLEKDDIDEPVTQWGNLPPKAILRVVLGLAWEDWLGPRLPMTYHPRSFCLDDVWGSADGISADTPNQLTIHEIKLTWTSAKRNPEDRWMWMKQTQSYCWMLETGAEVPCRRARWYEFNINGDYTWGDGGGPMHRVWDLEFTEDELRSTWTNLILKYKDDVEVES